jgi:hypothetical protein
MSISKKVFDLLQFSSSKDTIGGFVKKDSPNYKNQKVLIPGGLDLINFQKYCTDVLMYHSMNEKTIQATFSHYLESYIILEHGKNYYIPEQYREEMIKNTINFLTESGFQHDEVNVICVQWNDHQVELDEEKQNKNKKNEKNNKKNDSQNLSSNPFTKLNVIGAGNLIEATENITIFDDNVLVLGNAVNLHLQSCLNALIAGLVVWGKSGSIELGLTQFKAMGSEQIMSNASTLEKALNINVGIRAFIKVMEESFSDPHNKDHVSQLKKWLTYSFGNANEYESNLGTYLSLKQLVSITPQGRTLNENDFVNQFFVAMKNSNDKIVQEVGIRMEHDSQHREDLNAASSHARVLISTTYNSRKSYNHDFKGKGKGRFGKGKGKGGAKGAKGKGGKGHYGNRGNRPSQYDNHNENEKEDDVNAFTAHKNKFNKKGNNDWKKKIKCYNCNKFGHFSYECKSENKNNSQSSQSNQFAALVTQLSDIKEKVDKLSSSGEKSGFNH